MKKKKNKKRRRVGVSDIEEGQDSFIDEDQAREDALLMNQSPSSGGAASDAEFMNRPLSHVSVTSMVSEGGTTTGIAFPAPSSVSQNTPQGNITNLPHALSPTSGVGGNSYSRSSAKSLEAAAQNAMNSPNNANDDEFAKNINSNNPDDVIIFSSTSDKSEGRLSKIAEKYQQGEQQKPSSTDIISDRTESTYSEPTYNTTNSSTTPTGSMRYIRAINGMSRQNSQQQQPLQGNPNASIGVTSTSFGEGGNSSLTALAGAANNAGTNNRRLTIKNLLDHDRNERAKLKRKHNKLKMLRKGIAANPDYFGPGTLNENTNNNPLVMSAAMRKMLKKKSKNKTHRHRNNNNNNSSSSSVSASSDDDEDIDVDDELDFIEKQQTSKAAKNNNNTNYYKKLIIDVEEDEDEGNYENEAMKLEDQLSDLAHEFNPDTLRKALAPRFVTDSYEEEFTRYGRRSELLPFRVIGIQITGLIALLIGVQWGVYGRGTDEAIAIMFTALVLSIVFVLAMIFFGDKECGGENNDGIDDDDLFDNDSSASSAIYENVEREVLRLRRNTFGSVPRTTLLLTLHYFAAGLTIIGTSLWGETYLSRGVLYLRFVCAVIKGSITSIPSWWGVIHDLVFPVGATAFAVGYRTPQNSVEERRRIEEIIFLVAGLYVGWLCRLSNELSNKNNFMSMRRNELSSKLLRARREAALEVVQMAIPRRYCPEILRKNVAYQDAIKQAAEERREKLRRIAEEDALREDEQQTMNSNNKNDRRNRHRQRFTSNSTSATRSSSNSSGANNTTHQQQQQLSQYSSATNQDGALLMKFSVIHEMKNASIAFIDLTATVADDVFLLQFILSKLEAFLEKFNHELRRRIKKQNNNNGKSSSSPIFGDCFVTKIKTVGSILMCAALPVGSSAENDENCNTELALYHFVIEALYYLNHTIQREVPQLFIGTNHDNTTLRSMSVDPQNNNNNNNIYSSFSQSESASRLRMEGIKEIASLRSAGAAVGREGSPSAAAENSNKSTLPPPPLQRENTAIGVTHNPAEQQQQRHLQVPSLTHQGQRRNSSNLSANNTNGSASAGAAFLQQQHQLQALSANEIRCGLHSGSVIGCVLGQERLSFDCLGSTVNQASRCMSTGEQGDTTMTVRFYSRLIEQQKRYDNNNAKVRTHGIASKLLLLNQQQQDATTNNNSSSSSMKKREMKGLGAVDVFVIQNESI